MLKEWWVFAWKAFTLRNITILLIALWREEHGLLTTQSYCLLFCSTGSIGISKIGAWTAPPVTDSSGITLLPCKWCFMAERLGMHRQIKSLFRAGRRSSATVNEEIIYNNGQFMIWRSQRADVRRILWKRLFLFSTSSVFLISPP